MIKDILTKAKSTFSQPISQPEPESAVPQPAPEPAPEPKPEAVLKAKPKSAKEFALETAAQVGYRGGEKVTGKILRAQTARHPKMLFVEVPDWSEPVVCWVKDANSWKPVNPPYDRLKCEFTGTADVEGRLVFQSADECKKSRLIRRK